MRTREALTGYLFLSPWLLGFLVFWVAASVSSLYFSFTDYSVLSEPRWVGLYNYVKLFTRDRLFVQSVTNTLYYVMIQVPLALVLSFSLALLLNTRVHGMTTFRTMIYLPSVVPTVATVAVWMWMFTPRIGLITVFLQTLGITPPNWLGNPVWSKPALILITLWGVGNKVVIFLAGLLSISEHLYEAAEVDGASGLQKLFRITIPMVTPTIFYNLIMTIIQAFQVFAVAYIGTGGGPMNSTRFYMLKLYGHAFNKLEMGYASAMAWPLFIMILVLTVVVFRLGELWVHYDI